MPMLGDKNQHYNLLVTLSVTLIQFMAN